MVDMGPESSRKIKGVFTDKKREIQLHANIFHIVWYLTTVDVVLSDPA